MLGRLFLHQLLDGATQLVGARRGLSVATYSIQSRNYILVFHTFYQLAYALQITVTSAVKSNICYTSILAAHLYCT
jgi:hypothetical protein